MKKILKDIDPNNMDALKNLANIYEKTGRMQQLQNINNRIFKINPSLFNTKPPMR